MTRLGLAPIPGVGADFDPLLHEALALAPVSDPALDGKVLMVHSEGWRVKGKVIQAAQVIVAKFEAPAATDDGDEPAATPADAAAADAPADPPAGESNGEA
jgi:molecular chaperone GrpE